MAAVSTRLGFPFMPWQRQVADVAGEIEPETGLPAYREVRVTVPRQSGKTSLTLGALVDRCVSPWPGGLQRVIYTAQDRISARAKWEEHVEVLQRTRLRRVIEVKRQNGQEAIIWPNRSRWSITASGESSGHGTTLDVGMIDEAWAQKDERLAGAFRPAMVTRPAAQMWIVSTMGTDESIFLHDRVDDGRAGVEDGRRSRICYFEWSAGDDDDPDEEATWWRCMPALGHTISIDTIRTDHEALDAGEFARAYLNRRAPGGNPVIDAASWAVCADPGSRPGRTLAMAVEVTPDRAASSIAVASRAASGRLHVEVVDHRPGVDWVVVRLLELQRQWHPVRTLFDPSSPAGSLALDFRAAGVAAEEIATRTYGQACGAFYDDVVARRIVHLSQPALDAAVGAARKRNIGDAWAWSRRAGSDISALVAATLARWALIAAGEGEPQIL
jgi:hypothetical protein